MRRLTRAEYDNTVRDLLGTKLQPGRGFLNDAPQFGFDNNADQLSLAPIQLEMYQKAAEQLAAEALTPAARPNLVKCDLASGDTCLRSIVTTFGALAYRRPVSTGEESAYLALAAKARAAGATADEALQTVLEAFLTSPHFLYRVEIDPDPTSMVPHDVGPYEMASRLSYLMYRSMPDNALFSAAAEGKLSQPADLQAQVMRMLAQPSGKVFAQDFANQWLGARAHETTEFNAELFPKYNAALAASMRAELLSFFDEFVRENRPVKELVTANFTYLDDNLARHYGLPAPGAAMTRQVLSTPQRGGLLTMGVPLTVTSHPNRSSVVKRGHWVMQELLCDEPPPPPPNVDALPDTPAAMGTTQRQLLEAHRAKPECMGCHVVMDNIGFALENYDAIGVYRTTEAGMPIDARGMMPDGTRFTGARELAAVLAEDPRFAPCVAEHLLAYALGRAIAPTDAPYVADIVGSTRNTIGVRQVLMNLIASDVFRTRRGEPN
jgi:hypothetical protein